MDTYQVGIAILLNPSNIPGVLENATKRLGVRPNKALRHTSTKQVDLSAFGITYDTPLTKNYPVDVIGLYYES